MDKIKKWGPNALCTLKDPTVFSVRTAMLVLVSWPNSNLITFYEPKFSLKLQLEIASPPKPCCAIQEFLHPVVRSAANFGNLEAWLIKKVLIIWVYDRCGTTFVFSWDPFYMALFFMELFNFRRSFEFINLPISFKLIPSLENKYSIVMFCTPVQYLEKLKTCIPRAKAS